MIRLSYSTINNCLQPENSHNWINKISGINIPETDSMKQGKYLHRKIQDQIKKDFLGYRFPIVEEKDQDERTHFEIQIDKEISVHGYLDGLNKRKKQFLEIKTGSKFWSINDFLKSEQLGIYSLGFPKMTKVICITALQDESLWKVQLPKVFEIPITEKMKTRARKYIQDAIDLFIKGDFSGGLTDGVCLGWCNYGRECLFKI